MVNFDENEFILKIDNGFPYKDEEKWKALVIEGASISPNASYMVLYEICRPPKRPRISKKQRLDMLEYWETKNNQPLQFQILRAAKHLILKERLPRNEAKNMMKQLMKQKGQHNALAIVLFAGGERDRQLRNVYDDVLQYWSKA